MFLKNSCYSGPGMRVGYCMIQSNNVTGKGRSLFYVYLFVFYLFIALLLCYVLETVYFVSILFFF